MTLLDRLVACVRWTFEAFSCISTFCLVACISNNSSRLPYYDGKTTWDEQDRKELNFMLAYKFTAHQHLQGRGSSRTQLWWHACVHTTMRHTWQPVQNALNIMNCLLHTISLYSPGVCTWHSMAFAWHVCIRAKLQSNAVTHVYKHGSRNTSLHGQPMPTTASQEGLQPLQHRCAHQGGKAKPCRWQLDIMLLVSDNFSLAQFVASGWQHSWVQLSCLWPWSACAALKPKGSLGCSQSDQSYVGSLLFSHYVCGGGHIGCTPTSSLRSWWHEFLCLSELKHD